MKGKGKLRFTVPALLATAVLFTAAPLAAQEGRLRTRVDPGVAGVFVDGKYYGTAAMFAHQQAAIQLAPGNYTVKLVDPRYKEMSVAVGIEAGKTTTLRRAMESLGVKPEGPFGVLETQGYGNAAVYLNGKYYANTAELASAVRTLLLNPNEYDLKIVPVVGSAGREEKITINADETLILSKRGATVRRK